MTALHRTIHGGLRQLGITEEEDRRALYQRITGQPRLSLMTFQQEQAVVDELRRLGFKPASKPVSGTRKKLTGKFAKKMQALWIAGWNLGVVRNRDDDALRAFICGRAQIDAAEWLRFADDAKRCIEPLKVMLSRDGGVDWAKSRFLPPHTQVYGYRIASAQWKKLGETRGLVQAAHAIAGRPGNFSRMLTDEEWIVVMNELGKRVRARKEGA